MMTHGHRSGLCAAWLARAWRTVGAVIAVAAVVPVAAAESPSVQAPPGAKQDATVVAPAVEAGGKLKDKDQFGKMSLEELLSLDLVSTTATKTAVVADEVPSITTIIPQTTLLAFGFRTVPEALASVAGLYVYDDGVTSNVGVRGIFGGPDSWSRVIKVLVDGIPVTDYATGGTLLGPETIPIQAVDSIEVVRGPASALYGANAFLGVVNIVTKKPQPGGSLWAAAELATTNNNLGGSGQAMASVSSDDKKASFLLAFSAEQIDRSGIAAPQSSPSYNTYAGLKSTGDESRPMSVFGKALVDKGKLGVFEGHIIYQRVDANADWSTVSVLSPQTRIARENNVFGLDHRLSFTNEIELHTFASYTAGRTLPQETLDTNDPLFLIHRDHVNTAWAAGTELSWTHGKASVLAGFDFLRDTDSGDTIYQVTSAAQGFEGAGDRVLRDRGQQFVTNNSAGYAQALVPLFADLSAMAGVRADINSRFGTTVSSRGGFVYQPVPSLHLKLLYGDSFVPPSPSELYAAPLRDQGGIVGNANLKPQRGRNVEAAVTYKYLTKATLQVSVFGMWVNDMVQFIERSSQNEATNFTNIFCYGVEAQATVRQAPFFVMLDASSQRVSLTAPRYEQYWYQITYGSGAAGGSALPNYPSWIAHVSAGVTLRDYFVESTVSLGVYGSRKSSIDNIRAAGQSYLLDTYETFGFNIRSVGLHLLGDTETSVSLHAANVINQSYANGGALGVDIPGLGRSLFLKISQEL